MKIFNKAALCGSTSVCSVALAATLALGGAAQAQDSAPAIDSTCADDNADGVCNDQDRSAIIVTGSRIRRPNLDSTIPITSVGTEQVLETGQVSVGDQLNQLPQLRTTFTQANSTRAIGTAGLSLLDLRGLGTQRTLTLVNGRRHVSTVSGSFAWDVNNVPADLIERVDLVTGGNSAIYGSDAVAGVVNFILKDKFEGLQLRAQAGVSGEGDSGSQFVAGVWGKNFGDGRGNVTVAGEFVNQDALYLIQRLQGRDRRQFQLTQNLGGNLQPSLGAIRTTGEPATGDGISDTTFIGRLQRVSTSVGGSVTATCPTVAATGESAAAFSARRALTCSGLVNPASANPLSQFGNSFAFQPDGTLVPNGCITDFRQFGSGNCIGGRGSTLREAGQFQPELQRYNATLLAHYEISPAFVPFFEGQFTRVDAIQESSPTFGAQAYRVNNPFLTAQARGFLTQILAPGATTFANDRQNLDFGARGEDHKRETWRGVAGARGDFNDDWNYEVSASYGEFKSYYETAGNILTSRFNNAINAVLAPVGFTGGTALNQSGQHVACAINTDVPTTNDDAACIPVNLFGQGNVSPEALNYFGYTSFRNQKNKQFLLNAFVSGDTSGFFNLPGGPVGFAVGGEYRTEKQFSQYDVPTAQGLTFLNLLPDFAPPTYKVKEAFAEVRFPLLAGVPLAEELTVEAAGRVSDYNLGLTGTVYAYNAGIIYAPVRDIRFRASYQRSVRAPTLGDLFTAPTQTFNNAFEDPCGLQNINRNPNRIANCAALGVPTTQTFTVGGVTTTEPFSNRPTSGVAAANQGNPNLREETGDSYTLGAVFQPRFIPGFSLSFDYYDITIKNAIFTLAPQTVIDQCYDSTSGVDNPFCAQTNRLANGTFAGQRTVFHAGGQTVTLNNLGFSSLGGGFNYAKLETSGIDAELNYRREVGEDTAISFRSIVSYLIKRNAFTNIIDPTFRNRLKSELGDAEWRAQMTTKLDFGKLAIQHKVQYVGKQVIGAYETLTGIDGRPPNDPDALPRKYYPVKWYHDLRAEIDVTDRFRFYTGIDNVFDVRPPFDLLGTEAGAPYDPTGRYFYAGVRAIF